MSRTCDSRVRATPLSTLRTWPDNPRTIAPDRLEDLKRALAADAEMLFPLRVGDLVELGVGALVRRVVDEHVDAPERLDSLVDDAPAVARIGQVTAYERCQAAFLLDPAGGLGRVLVFLEVGDQDVRAFPGKCDGDSPPDPAVAAGDDRLLPLEPPVAGIELLAVVRQRIHQGRQPGRALLLRVDCVSRRGHFLATPRTRRRENTPRGRR